MSHKSLSSRVFPHFRQHLCQLHMGGSLLLLGNLAGEQKGRKLFPPFLWVNCPTAQCMCFSLVLHSLLLLVSSGSCLLSHLNPLTSLRDSNLLLLWYYTGFISIYSTPFVTVFTCNPHTDISSLVFSKVQIIISCHTFPIQMYFFFLAFFLKYINIFIFILKN